VRAVVRGHVESVHVPSSLCSLSDCPSARSVTFACHDVFAELVQRAGCRYARLAGDVRAGAVSRSPSPPAQAEAHWAQQFADLEVAAAAASPSCVCFNWFGQHAQTLAQSLRVPCVALFPAAPTTRTRAFPCPLLGLAQPGGSDCLRTYVLFEAVVWRSHCSPICAWRSRLGLAELGDTGHAALKAPILYGFSETILPPPKDWPSRVVLTGAWTRPLDPAWAPTPALAQFMDQPGAHQLWRERESNRIVTDDASSPAQTQRLCCLLPSALLH